MKRYSYVRAVVSALACIVGLSSLHAQVRNDTVPRKSGIEKATLRLPDSVRLAFRRLCDGTMHPVEPTRLDVYRFNPLDKQPLPYHHLGNVGSPALALFLPYAPEKVGFRLGLNAYNLYLPASHDSLLFYDAPRAYSDVLYTQAGDKEQGNLFAQVGTNLSPTLSLGVDYRIFTQQGAFARQRVRHTHLSLAAWFHPTNGRYEGFLSGFTNVARQQESGGIANDSLLSVADFANRQSIPVRLQLAESRTEKHSIQYAQYYTPTRGLTFGHRIEVARQQYHYFDQTGSEDTTNLKAIYGAAVVAASNNGLRELLVLNSLENTLSVGNKARTLADTVARPHLVWEATAEHRYFGLSYETAAGTPPEHFQNVIVGGSVAMQDVGLKRSRLYGTGSLGMVGFQNAGDYQLRTGLVLPLFSFGSLEGRFATTKYSPSLTETRLRVSNEEVWTQALLPTTQTSLGAWFDAPRWLLKASVEQRTVEGLVYWDAVGSPKQADKLYAITQFTLEKDFAWRGLHFDNWGMYQTASTTDYIHLPTFSTRHALYWEGELFRRKFRLRGGAQVRLTDSYYTPNYAPLTQSFYYQSVKKYSYYPAADAFVSFGILSFRGFLMFENVTQLITAKSYTTTAGYPMRDFNFRFGITWRFRN